MLEDTTQAKPKRKRKRRSRKCKPDTTAASLRKSLKEAREAKRAISAAARNAEKKAHDAAVAAEQASRLQYSESVINNIVMQLEDVVPQRRRRTTQTPSPQVEQEVMSFDASIDQAVDAAAPVATPAPDPVAPVAPTVAKAMMVDAPRHVQVSSPRPPYETNHAAAIQASPEPGRGSVEKAPAISDEELAALFQSPPRQSQVVRQPVGAKL